MRNKLLLFCISAVIIFSSCQKELAEEGLPTFCTVSSITIKNATGNVTAVYEYEYDSVLRRPTKLSYRDFELNITKEVVPVYSGDTVFLGLNSYLVIDPSKRLKKLTEADAAQGLINGDYYFNYNSSGQLSERLIDDGFNDAFRTNFNYTNENLTDFTEDVPGIAQPVSSTVTYGNSPQIKANAQYTMLELFPELLLYMPLFQLGKISSLLIATVASDVTVPGSPLPVTITTSYTNYTLTSEGWPSAFESKTTVGNTTAASASYEFQYRCFD